MFAAGPMVHSAEIAPDGYEPGYSSDTTAYPKAIQDLMQVSRLKYMEGSSFLKAGDTDKARESFNKAVDLLLQSDWDIPSTPTLGHYFQELVQKIQEDESRYLTAPGDVTEEIETAVVDELDQLDLAPALIDPTIQALENEIAGTSYEIPITVNEMVAKSLDYWLKGGRKYFVDGLVRSGQYRPMIERVFREESIPIDLMYLAQVESLFKTHAVSKAKAKGIWQFEKATAIRYGLKVTKDVDERSDPEKSTRAAARYLNDLFIMFKDWNLALAAYNWGEGKVQRLINSTGMNDFWKLVDLRRRLPEETKNHVPLIQASVILGRNPEKFGLPTELAPPLKYSEVSVSRPIDLRAAARVLSTSIDELKKLNPALRGLTTPANYPNFQLKVPADTDPKIHRELASLPTAKIVVHEAKNAKYKVKAGDTLSRIAAKHHVSVSELERANSISSKKKLKAGTFIQIPARGISGSTESVAKNSKGHLLSAKATQGKSKPAKAKVSSEKKASGKVNGRKRDNAVKQAKAKVWPKAQSASLKHTLDSQSSRKQLASK
jgi:membrane-bound lytic murein transglycosylase D